MIFFNKEKKLSSRYLNEYCVKKIFSNEETVRTLRNSDDFNSYIVGIGIEWGETSLSVYKEHNLFLKFAEQLSFEFGGLYLGFEQNRRLKFYFSEVWSSSDLIKSVIDFCNAVFSYSFENVKIVVCLKYGKINVRGLLTNDIGLSVWGEEDVVVNRIIDKLLDNNKNNRVYVDEGTLNGLEQSLPKNFEFLNFKNSF